MDKYKELIEQYEEDNLIELDYSQQRIFVEAYKLGQESVKKKRRIEEKLDNLTKQSND